MISFRSHGSRVPGPRRPQTPARACETAGHGRPGACPLRKLQSQGVHHITLVGADRQTSIGFWEGVLGMPFVFEQPNLDNAAESHLYFDPGDGRLITVFTSEERTP
ncbi:MAG TPA: VOC family protein, partial [Gaiellaceae bacterium]|nr:VOC family protein [Gaiellaceae bacterium]